MQHFTYPNAKFRDGHSTFIGCGRFLLEDYLKKTAIKGYSKADPSTINITDVMTAATLLAPDSFDTGKEIYWKKDEQEEKYEGDSQNFAYLMTLISRSRRNRLECISGDIWCTGGISIADKKHPILSVVDPNGFDAKLEGFLSEDNRDRLFLVPMANIKPAHESLLRKNDVRVVSVEQFKKLSSENLASQKTIVQVKRDEIEHIVTILFHEPSRKKIKRSVMLWTFAITTLAIFVGSLYWYFDAYVLEYVEYYHSYARRGGFMQGVGRLTEEQVKHRTFSYKFTHKGRRNPVWKVQTVNSDDELALSFSNNYFSIFDFAQILLGDEPSDCEWEFEHTEQKLVVYEKVYGPTRQFIYGLLYSPENTGQTVRRAQYIGDDGLPKPLRGTHAEFVEITYSKRGNEIQLRYTDSDDEPRTAINSAYRLQQEFNDEGLVIEQAYFGTNNEPILFNGYHKLWQEYDEDGKIMKQWYFGKYDQNPVYLATLDYDQYGNCTEIAYFNPDNRPVLYKNEYHKIHYNYNKSGRLIGFLTFDTEGHPASPFGVHKVALQTNERNNFVECALFDIDNRPVLFGSVHKITFVRDEYGRIVKSAYFGINGSPTLNDSSVHKIIHKYEINGQFTKEETYFGTDGQPVVDSSGCHKLFQRFDKYGQAVEVACFDSDGLSALADDKHHKFTNKYDERGNVIERMYFGSDGRPIPDDQGVYKTSRKYNRHGNIIEERYFDLRNRPMVNDNGCHKISRKYDEGGHIAEEMCFDVEQSPKLDNSGVHKITLQPDEHRNVIEMAYFDLDGLPVSKMGIGCQKIRARYDEYENLVEEDCFDNNNAPMLNNKGYHSVKRRFDKHGHIVESMYFDLQKQQLDTEVVAMSALPESQAERLGIEAGDVFINYDGKPIFNTYTFITQRDTEPLDAPAKELIVLRNEKKLKFMVRPGKIGVALADQVVQ